MSEEIVSLADVSGVRVEMSSLEPLVAEAEWHGEIATAPRGTGGFGYDPLFYLPYLDKTAAELEPAQKNLISHRGQALAKLLELLKAA